MDKDFDHRLQRLQQSLAGELLVDFASRQLYATDASIYEQIPAAVAIPQNDQDIERLVHFAGENRIGLIPRTAGTSLAGQVVGSGIVVDVSRHFTRIIDVDEANRNVRVQPGVVRDELNLELAKNGLFFAPETSTSNRAMIGGMLGNNSCGSNSIVYGNTRDHVIEISGFLSDGSRVSFGPLSQDEFAAKCDSKDGLLETKIYRQADELFGNKVNRDLIESSFPARKVERRNNGYALDEIACCEPFEGNSKFNFTKLVAGSEGTLCFATELLLNCEPLPPPQSALLCAHFATVHDALVATPIAMKHLPFRCELIDDKVIEGARQNLELTESLHFVELNPAAILLVEFRDQSAVNAAAKAKSCATAIQAEIAGTAFPVLGAEAANDAWAIRRAGLGVVHATNSDRKPVTVVEDMAVAVDDLAPFIADVDKVLADQFGTECVHYGHAGAGELHLRPELDLKTDSGRRDLRGVAEAMLDIVKKYHGSISGEHGDGRLRSEFLRRFLGEQCYEMMKQVKQTWDPQNVFNPGRIVDGPAMDTQLRTTELKSGTIDGSETGRQLPQTTFRFADTGGLLEAVEKCSGSGDCRKSHLIGGTMCPSYMATRNERDSTRARANLLRQTLADRSVADPLGSRQVKGVMDLCLSCKACKSECPSSVDMARVKAEFMHGFHQQHGAPLRSKLLASFERLARQASRLPRVTNWLSGARFSGGSLKKLAGIDRRRTLPQFHPFTLRSWFEKRGSKSRPAVNGQLVLFCDEFTNYLDVPVGIAAIELLEGLGFGVEMVEHVESGRTAISTGMLGQARQFAENNVQLLAEIVNGEKPLIGIEPSAILTFRDEYPDLVRESLAKDARSLANNTWLIDEFLSRQIECGIVGSSSFDESESEVLLHGHCHQKALSSLDSTLRMLQLPANFRVQPIASGCCGMAGFFGYQAENYDISMQIGELVLFPAVRGASESVVIAAVGTSCRHQIQDGTGRVAWHPVQLLRDCLLI